MWDHQIDGYSSDLTLVRTARRPRRWCPRPARVVQALALIASVLTLGMTLGGSFFVGPIAFTPDGRFLVGAVNGYPWPGIKDHGLLLYGVIKVWETRTGVQRARLAGQTTWLRSIAISPDGSTLATSGDTPLIEVWNLPRGIRKGFLAGHTGRVGDVAFDPSGATLASANWDGEVRLWDAATWQTRVQMRVDEYGAYDLAFSPDRTALATTDSRGVSIWDTRDGRRTREIADKRLGFLGFTGAGENYLLARFRGHHGEGATVLDGATGAERFELRMPSHSTGPRLSADGGRIAVPEQDGAVAIRDASSGKVLVRATGLARTVRCLAFSPGGESLAAGDDSGVICIWETRTGVLRARCGTGDPIRRWGPAGLALLALTAATIRLRRANSRRPKDVRQ